MSTPPTLLIGYGTLYLTFLTRTSANLGRISYYVLTSESNSVHGL